MKDRYHPLARCEECPLRDLHNYVPSHIPEGELDFIAVGEAPGQQEVANKRPFVGPSGKLLDVAIRKAGQDPDRIARTNTVSCRPPGNATPSQEAVEACWGRLSHELEMANTDKIVLMGKVATEEVMMRYGCEEEAAIAPAQRRGKWYRPDPDSELGEDGKIFFQTYHPAFVLRKVSEGKPFMRDIARVYENPRPRIEMQDPAPERVVVRTTAELYQQLSKCPDNQMTAYDLETNNVFWYSRPGKPYDPVLMAAIAWEDHRGLIIGDELLYNEPHTAEILDEFCKRVRICAHNGKFDVIYSRSHLGFRPTVDFDTMLAHYCVEEDGQHGLKYLASEYLGAEDYEGRLIKRYLSTKNDEYSKIPFGPLSEYAVRDVCMTLRLQRILEAQLHQQDLYEWPFNQVIMPIQDALSDVQYRGIRVDVGYLKEARTGMEEDIEVLRNELRLLSGRPELNPNAWQQVSEVIYQQFKLPPTTNRRMRDKKHSTSAEAIEHLIGKHPFVDALVRYRRVAKLKSSYIDNLINYASVDGRIHTDFMVMGTEIGRLAARNPALQTIPRTSDKYGALVRNAFCADPDHKLIVADYSQAELRVAAALSGEPFLLDVYNNDRDLHDEGTNSMYGTAQEIAVQQGLSDEDAQTRWKEDRTNVKMFNFSYLYGGNEFSFAQKSGFPFEKARAFVRRYEQNMPRLAAWKARQFELVKQCGFVESIFGRRRRWAFITNSNSDEARKSAAHFKVASPSSDITLLSLCQMVKEGIDVQLTVHDSNVACAHESEVADVSRRMQEIMYDIAVEHIPEVRWKVDADISYRWGAKE